MNPPANAGDTGDSSLIPGSERSPGGENDNPLQNSCLENLMDRGAWWATVRGGLKESDMPEQLSKKRKKTQIKLLPKERKKERTQTQSGKQNPP